MTLKVRNHPLNPTAQLVHPSALANMTDILLAPGHLRAAEAFVALSSTLVFIISLIYRGWGKYGWRGRNLPSNVRGLLASRLLILSDFRRLDHLEGSLKDIRARMIWDWRIADYLCDTGEGDLGCHDVDGGRRSMKELLVMKKWLHMKEGRDLRLRLAITAYNIFDIVNMRNRLGSSQLI